MAPLRRTISPALLAVAIAAPVALADPAGKTTLEETVVPGSGAYAPLTAGPEESYVVRRAPGAKARANREDRRRSLVFFGQLTDPQIVDEESPARVDFIDGAGGDIKSAHRPQEALGPHVFDSIVRNMNANPVSRVPARKGTLARLRFAITTGDLADNQQENESRWFTSILDGGTVDPSSGKVPGPGNECSAEGAERDRIIAEGQTRSYTGVQDFDDYRGAPADRYADYWDPDEAGPPGPYSAFPRYPGLMDKAQQPFDAEGLDVEWYVARGNHDGLIQGNAPGSEPLFRSIATGCLKVFPNSEVDPAQFRGKDEAFLFEQLGNPEFIARLLAGGRTVAPDPERKIVSKAEYKTIVGGNGFQKVSRSENRRSRGTASYYAITKGGVRFIALDTVAEGGGQHGNLDHAQYRWLARELKKAKRRRQLAIAYGHHPMRSMINQRTDEQAGACDPQSNPEKVGCDVDPRNSAPIHRGLVGRKSVRSLFLKHRLLAYVAGHIHANRVTPYKRGKRAFWEIATASHIDWPHQSRTIEVMDNRDRTISLFGTILEGDAPTATPFPGDAAAFTTTDLASIARQLAWNDPQRAGTPASGEDEEGQGRRKDRNVELLIRDPRRRR